MKYYELNYLAAPEISEEELKVFSQKVSDFIVQEKGILGQAKEPVKKRLAYSIKGRNEVFLITINFQLSPENLEKLEKNLKSEQQILRYLLLTKGLKEKAPRKAPRRPLVKTLLTKKEKTTKATHKPLESQKIELKEIDKKIEEILKE